MDNKTEKTSNENVNSVKPAKRWIALLLSIIALIIVIIVLDEMDKEQAITSNKSAAENFPASSYINVVPQTYQAGISVLAEVVPRWNTAIRSFVRGEVSYISPALLEGTHVKEGDILLKIQDSTYRASVADARKNLNQANVQLLRAQRDARQASRNWKRSEMKGKPDSPLTLKIPQLKAAEGEFEAAKATLADAENQLKYTQLKAPYDGLIITKSVNPGEFVESGQLLFQIMDVRTLDIPVMLDDKQWQLLSSDWQGTAARIISINREQQWTAAVQRKGGYIDKQTRLRRLYLNYQQVPDSIEGLLPGEFVRVELTGKDFDNLLKLPQSAYTRNGFVWYLDSNNRLNRYRVKPVFADSHFFYVSPPIEENEQSDHKASFRVIVNPLASFIPGIKVAPKLHSSQADNIRSTESL